tara:strand:- start:165 stop:395 length:231 start_codon:yes stop_codon:yes gene_type:complete
MSQEQELKQNINALWKKLNYPYHRLDKKILQGWESQYDTNLDPTNLAQFLIDRYDKPILYLHTFLSNVKIDGSVVF